MTALDVKEKLISVRYDAYPNFTWHHRLLLRGGEGQSWIVLTPTLEVQEWVIAEPQHERFAEPVEASILGDPERCALLGKKGAAHLEEDD